MVLPRKRPPFDHRAPVRDVLPVGGIGLPVAAAAEHELPAEHVTAIRADQRGEFVVDLGELHVWREYRTVLAVDHLDDAAGLRRASGFRRRPRRRGRGRRRLRRHRQRHVQRRRLTGPDRDVGHVRQPARRADLDAVRPRGQLHQQRAGVAAAVPVLSVDEDFRAGRPGLDGQPAKLLRGRSGRRENAEQDTEEESNGESIRRHAVLLEMTLSAPCITSATENALSNGLVSVSAVTCGVRSASSAQGGRTASVTFPRQAARRLREAIPTRPE